MCIRFSGSGPIPPRIPKIVCTNSGGSTTPALDEVGEVVEVPDVVALELEPGPFGAEQADDRLDVLVRVPEDEIAGHLQVLALPGVLELRDPVEHREQPEVHAPHVQRAQLRLEPPGRLRSLLDRHSVAAAGGDVDHHVAASGDPAAGTRRRHPGRAIGTPGLGVPGVEMDDRGSSFGRPDRALRDLRGRDREVRVCDGTWIDPVTAQLTITLPLLAIAGRIFAHREFGVEIFQREREAIDDVRSTSSE